MKMPDGTLVTTDGWYSSEDTGGAITVKKLDLYMGAYAQSPQYKQLALAFGRRNVSVRYRK